MVFRRSRRSERSFLAALIWERLSLSMSLFSNRVSSTRRKRGANPYALSSPAPSFSISSRLISEVEREEYATKKTSRTIVPLKSLGKLPGYGDMLLSVRKVGFFSGRPMGKDGYYYLRPSTQPNALNKRSVVLCISLRSPFCPLPWNSIWCCIVWTHSTA